MKKLVLILAVLASMLSYQADAKKIALLIGVERYPATSGWTTLHSMNDVQLLETSLKRAGFAVYKLTDKNATHQGILNAIGSIKCAPGDMVWIHFSGHGQQMTDVMGDEKQDALTEAFIPWDAQKRPSKTYKGQNHLTDDEINEALIPLRNRLTAKGQLLVTFDACHSADGARGDDEDELSVDDDDLIARGTSIVFKLGKRITRKNKISNNAASLIEISACQSSEVNYEYKNQYGSLSYLLSMAIKQQGKKVNFLKLAQYVTNKAHYSPVMPKQTPNYEVY